MCFGDDFADAARGDAVAIERRDGGVGGFGRDGNQQAAGSLRVEEEVAIFLLNAVCKTHAIANEIAVIFESAGEESSARGFDSAAKVRNSRMIDLEGDGFDITRRISHRHLPRVA